MSLLISAIFFKKELLAVISLFQWKQLWSSCRRSWYPDTEGICRLMILLVLLGGVIFFGETWWHSLKVLNMDKINQN